MNERGGQKSSTEVDPSDPQERSDCADTSAACKRGRPRSEAVKENVLRAANELLDERGFKAMTIESIAERAGASKVTLYRWWPNKAAIVMEAFLAAYGAKTPWVHTDSVIDDLRAHMIVFVKVLGGRPGVLLAGLAAEGVLDAEVGDAFRTLWIVPRRAEATKSLKKGVASGELRADLDVEAVIDALYGPMYYRLLVKHAPLTRAYALSLWDVVMRGIAATPEARERAGHGAERTPK